MMYYSCVYSVVTYCIAVWGGVFECVRSEILCKLHKRILNNLFRKFYPDSPCIFKACKLLKLKDIYKYRVALYMYKILKLNKYPSLQRNLDILHSEHRYDTRSASRLIEPFPRTLAIQLSFKYQFIKIWNNIPDEIKNCATFGIFKKCLYAHFIDMY